MEDLFFLLKTSMTVVKSNSHARSLLDPFSLSCESNIIILKGKLKLSSFETTVQKMQKSLTYLGTGPLTEVVNFFIHFFLTKYFNFVIGIRRWILASISGETVLEYFCCNCTALSVYISILCKFFRAPKKINLLTCCKKHQLQ